ncbi:c-type cytochrome [Methyloceanibacter caenitepidi]|uniref:Cytochrome c4 n=1 Tax=Methyloceanibacter caenitepidi TaxID=1384459 RepID=A0A0A8JYU2_9HYPH|nr:c-type cytochrome [Methyloceanibacter caenitepidi]BAQ15968.1 cytochrome c4 [Methyloceanibacter caenitepidi]
MSKHLILAAAVVAAFVAPDVFAADAENGKQLYATCAACHGPAGAGNEALGAPPIAGMPAWYTVRQLNNFKTGIRGADPKDTHGQQMAPMAKMLGTDEDVADVAAYIETLQ